MAKILIIEDDDNIRFLLRSSLKDAYKIIEANNGAEGFQLFLKEAPDLIITDIMMPEIDGITLAKQIRQHNSEIPLLMLTAKTTINSKIEGFNSGADDYLVKPVDLTELQLRIAALLRRAKINTNQKLQIGITTINELNYSVEIASKKKTLPKKEFEVLFKLLSYPQQIFTPMQLLDEIWGKDNFSGEETVKTHISRIRKAIKDSPDIEIKTIRGLGYQGEIHETRK